MKKILHIIIGLNVGGAERSLQRLIEAHRNNPEYQHTVISLTTTGKIGEELIESGIKVIPLGMTSFLSFPLTFIKLITAIKRQQPDIIHTWMYHADLMGGLAAWILRKKVIWSVRVANLEGTPGVAKSTKYIYKVCGMLSSKIPSKIVFVSHSAKLTHVSYNNNGKVIITNGYDVDAIQNVVNTTKTKKIADELNLANNIIRIVSIGRFNHQKDFPTFIRAASILLKNNSNLQFILIGRGLNRKNTALCTLIDSTSKPDSFLLLDERNDVLALLNMMDIFCLHSVSEGFPNVLGEAMSLGIPCVTTDVGDAALMMGDEQKKFVVPAKNPEALAQALQHLIDLSPQQRQDIGNTLRLRIQQHFSLQSTVQAYEQVYQEVVNT